MAEQCNPWRTDQGMLIILLLPLLMTLGREVSNSITLNSQCTSARVKYVAWVNAWSSTNHSSGGEKTAIAWVNQVNLWALCSPHCFFHSFLCNKPLSYKHNVLFFMWTELNWKKIVWVFKMPQDTLLCTLYLVPLFFQKKKVNPKGSNVCFIVLVSWKCPQSV